MSKRQTYIECPICGKEFKSLGYARHRAMHRDNANKVKLNVDTVKLREVCLDYQNTLYPQTDLCDNCGERKGKH